jgi:hypothetical protein
MKCSCVSSMFRRPRVLPWCLQLCPPRTWPLLLADRRVCKFNIALGAPPPKSRREGMRAGSAGPAPAAARRARSQRLMADSPRCRQPPARSCGSYRNCSFDLCTAKTGNPGLNLSIGSPISSASGIIPVRNRAIDRDRLNMGSRTGSRLVRWAAATRLSWAEACNNCRDSVRKEKPWPQPRLGREGRVACSTACSRISLLLLSS